MMAPPFKLGYFRSQARQLKKYKRERQQYPHRPCEWITEVLRPSNKAQQSAASSHKHQQTYRKPTLDPQIKHVHWEAKHKANQDKTSNNFSYTTNTTMMTPTIVSNKAKAPLIGTNGSMPVRCESAKYDMSYQ